MKLKLTKVVYFDETTALDYVEIKDSGRYVRNMEQEAKMKGGAEAEVAGKVPSVFSFIGVKAKLSASAEGQHIIRNTLTNTILTDFINKSSENEDEVSMLVNYKIELAEETTLKLYTAITDATTGTVQFDGTQGASMEISKLGTVLSNLQGYLECYGTIDGKRSAILRFNNNSFRNNYRLADIINMNLTYYGVKVGVTNKSTLKMLGLNLTGGIKDTREKIDIELSDNASNEAQNLEVYDVVLAGVFNDKE